MTLLVDTDGTPLRRTRDGDLVPDLPSPDAVPTYPPGTPCGEHGPSLGQTASHCRPCWSEALAGDRPRAFIGRTY